MNWRPQAMPKRRALKARSIGSDEVSKGKQYFVAEVKIEEGDELVGRFVASVGASPIENGRETRTNKSRID